VTKTFTLTAKEVSTIRLALLTFRADHQAQAKQMDAWAEDATLAPATQAKCRANAAASRNFASDADDLLSKVSPETPQAPQLPPEPTQRFRRAPEPASGAEAIADWYYRDANDSEVFDLFTVLGNRFHDAARKARQS
jgi:hypothetical protein